MIKKQEALEIKTGFTPSDMVYLMSTNKYFETGVSEDNLDFTNTDEPIFDHYQYVIEAGEGCRFKKGDKLLLDLEQFLVRRENPNNRGEILQSLEFSKIDINEDEFMFVDDSRRFIKGKLED